MGRLVLIMGVSGCGKSTVGEKVAQRIGAVYLEGDELHPPGNIEKMSSGVPLQDEDRWPWFDRIIEAAVQEMAEHETVLVGCSALKQSYRDYLFERFDDSWVVFLDGSFELIHERMKEREHFMPPSLLESQFATLERPADSEPRCLAISIDNEVDDIVDKITDWLSSCG